MNGAPTPVPTTARLTATAVTLALAGAVTAAAPATASTRTPASSKVSTLSPMMRFAVGGFAVAPETGHARARDVATLRRSAGHLRDNGFIVTGITDRNRDGLDDDGRVTISHFARWVRLDLRQPYGSAAELEAIGFTLRDRRAVLKESAQNLDKVLVSLHSSHIHSWSMSTLNALRHEVAPGVRVTSAFDGNNDGLDDDGRLTLTKDGKAVTLTLGTKVGQRGTISYGPTWAHPVKARSNTIGRTFARQDAARDAASTADTIRQESRWQKVSGRDIRLLESIPDFFAFDNVPTRIQLGGVTDRNRDGLDDDGVVTVNMNGGADVYRLTIGTKVGAKVTYTRIKG